ncbi:MAG: hypothetical protein V1858_00130 [Candidatus Gottesmanbacteria bacterium]
MKKICLIIPLIFFIFPFVFTSDVLAQVYGACTSFESCPDEHGCPGGGTTGYKCCPSCGAAVICVDDPGCGYPMECTYTNDCGYANPYCPVGQCSSIACINGSCVSTCNDCDSGPGPTPTSGPPTSPPPDDTGTLIGRIWNDINANGLSDEILADPADPNSVQNPADKCGSSYINANVWISYAQIGNSSNNGWIKPNLCNPGPYYSKTLAVGSYLVGVDVSGAPGWSVSTTSKILTVSKNQPTTQWYGIYPQTPTCSISVSRSAAAPGETVSINVNGSDPIGRIQTVWLYYRTTSTASSGSSGWVTLNPQSGSCNNSSCSYSYQWNTSGNPIPVGNYYLTCLVTTNFLVPGQTRSCHGNPWCTTSEEQLKTPAPIDCFALYQAKYDCGPDDLKTVTIRNYVGWFQTAGGDVHGSAVSTEIPATCTGSCIPYFSRDLE